MLWVLIDGEVAAACLLSDRVRSDSAKAVRALHELGITPAMLTGDAEPVARAVCAAVGIRAPPRAGVAPSEKLLAIREWAKAGPVAMVGDGVNDGPALAAADVGIAMGVQGTAMAAEAAGVVLMTNDLRKLADAVVGARRCTRVMMVSVAVALVLKLAPFAFMAAAGADRYLIVVAVASDVLGIAWVLLAAMSLLHIKPRYAASPCGANDTVNTELTPAKEDDAPGPGKAAPPSPAAAAVRV